MAAPNPLTQALYDSLVRPTNVQRLVRERRPEGLYLEFKRKVHSDRPELDDGDRAALSKALSGFSNADGGILIFGVETKTGEDRVDRASKLRPIENVENFCGRLKSSIMESTQPPVDGVSIGVISSNSMTGYVKILVPPSDRPPHRAMAQLAGREYWLRTSDSFRRMEHYELEGVFGRRLRPLLRLHVRFHQVPITATQNGEQLVFHFLNAGRGIAKYAGFACFIRDQGVTIGVRSGGVIDLSVANGRPAIGWSDNNAVIHTNEIYASLGTAAIQRPAGGAPINLHLVWYAENMITKRQDVELQIGAEIEV